MRALSVWCVLFCLALLASCGGACGGTTGTTGGTPTGAADATAVFEHDGEITDRSERIGTGLGQSFQVAIPNAGSYAVTLSSSAFDPLLVVTTPDGSALSNDDWQGSREHAQLQLTIPSAPAQLRISATSNDGTGTGRYRLLVRRADGAAPADVPRVAAGGTYDGVVEGSDSALPDGRRYDTVLVEGPAEVRVSSTGGAAAAVAVVGPTGATVGQAQDGAYRIVQPGTHRVQLTADTQAAGARYHVEVGARPTAVQASMPTLGRNHHELPREGTGAALALDQIVRGNLAENDPRLPTGEVADLYQLTLAAGESFIAVELASGAFDPYLMVVGPTGQTSENDDYAGALNSRVELAAPAPGVYRVVATAYRGHERGAYELKVVRGAAAPPPAPSGGGNVAGTPVTGDTVQGALAAGDQQLQSGEWFDRHLMTFTAGEAVNLRLESRAFDTYLIVRTPSGQQHDNDDMTAATGTNSGVDIPAAEAGDYQIMVTSYRPGEVGAYTLRRERGAAVPRPNQEGGTGGRIFGVFAGISDYPGGGDLAECANDAIKLAETLRNAGLLTPERQVVLTDGQATVANVRAAMERMAREVGPDDVFVFFYSGHGGQRAGQQDARELDAMDETLVLHDAAMVDDDLGRLFDGVRARLSIAALDSCHSGGFAKDLVTRPGRVGLFSSEEDVLSAVAQQFQAGGYLSHFLRLAIGGDADANPRDRVLTVGELTHHLYTQFGAHAADVHLAAAYQHLVVDRGAVGVDQVLWSYR